MKSGVRAIDFMSTNVVKTTKDKTISEIAKTLNQYRIGGLPVVNSRGNLIGLITERDIMQDVIAKDKKPSRVTVGEIMSTKLVTATKFEDISEIAKKIRMHDLTRIPVVEGKKIIGFITNKDVLEQGIPLVDLILEQARIKGPQDKRNAPNALGKCEICGTNGNLRFDRDLFICEDC